MKTTKGRKVITKQYLVPTQGPIREKDDDGKPQRIPLTASNSSPLFAKDEKSPPVVVAAASSSEPRNKRRGQEDDADDPLSCIRMSSSRPSYPPPLGQQSSTNRTSPTGYNRIGGFGDSYDEVDHRPHAIRVRGPEYQDHGSDEEEEQEEPTTLDLPVAAEVAEEEPEVIQIRESARAQAQQEMLQNIVVADEDKDTVARNRRRWSTVAVVLVVAVLIVVLAVVFGKKDPEPETSNAGLGVCRNAAGPYEVGSSVIGNLNVTAVSQPFLCQPTAEEAFDASTEGVFYQVEGSGGNVKAFTCDTEGQADDLDTAISVYNGNCDYLTCLASNDDFCGEQSLVSWFANANETYYIFVSSSRPGSFILSMVSGKANDECEAAVGPLMEGSDTSVELEGGETRRTDSSIPPCGHETPRSGLWYTILGTGKGLRVSSCQSFDANRVSLSVYETEDGSCGSLRCKVGAQDIPTVATESCKKEAKSVSWRSKRDQLYFIHVGILSDSSSLGSLNLSVRGFDTTHDLCREAVAIEPSYGSAKSRGSTRSATRTGSFPACKRPLDSSGLWYRFVGSGTTMRASVCSNKTSLSAFLNVFENTCDELSCINGYTGGSSDCEINWVSEENKQYFVFVSATAEGSGNFELLVQTFQAASNDLCEDALEVVPSDDGIILGSTFAARQNDGDILYLEDYSDRCKLFGSFMPRFVPGLWYKVRGTGTELQVSTYNKHTCYDSIIAVAKGECGSLTCIAADDDSVTEQGVRSSWVIFPTSQGDIYYVLVSGWSISVYDAPGTPDVEDRFATKTDPPVGDFGLSVQELGNIANDQCIEAQEILPNGELTFGSSIGSTVSGIEGCHHGFINKGVFYKVRGTGSVLRAMLPFWRTDFYSRLSVYRNSCGDLECVGGQTELKLGISMPWGTVDWVSEPSESYIIHVYGLQDVGHFAMQVLELEERYDRPDNACEVSERLMLADPGSIIGSASSAAYSRHTPSCFSGSSKLGVWYSLQGQTEDAVSVSTCSSSTAQSSTGIQIYAGNSCESLSCVRAFQLSCDPGESGSALVWNADRSTHYYVVVETQAEGNFELSSSVIPAPINDSCDKAIDISIADGLIRGDIYLGAIDVPHEDRTRPYCGPFDRVSSGLWYRVTGTGSTLRVSTCTDETVLDTYITLFSGRCGLSALVCEDVNDDAPNCGKASTITWESISGEQYYAFVQGYEGRRYGEFGLILTQERRMLGLSRENSWLRAMARELVEQSSGQVVTVPDGQNDRCVDALDILPNSEVVYRGSTTSAAKQEISPCIPSPSATSKTERGVWFRVAGTGRGFLVSTCNKGNTFGNVVQVYKSKGDCSSLTCYWSPSEIEDMSDLGWGNGCPHAPGLTSQRRWGTNMGDTYYILLYGFEGDSGNYSLSLEEVDLESNDLCENAELIDTTKDVFVTGSTLSSTVDVQSMLCERYDFFDHGRLDMPGVWYELQTSERGHAFRASTCSSWTTYDTQLSVFEGENCDSLACVGINYDTAGCGTASSISWKAYPGQRYFLKVNGYWFRWRRGNFGLSVEGFSVPANDVCVSAIPIEASASVLNIGSTSNAFEDESAPFCFFPTVTSKSVWYTVLGSGVSLRATTCTNATNYDSRIAIFSGDDCETLRCVVANSDSAPSCHSKKDASTVQWNAAANQRYFILVFGAPGESGDFGLKVKAISDAPRNDNCADALSIVPGDAKGMTGSTMATSDDLFAPSCGSDDTKARGVWYEIQGTGRRIQASTCFYETKFPAKVAVYTGSSCEKLDCVDFALESGLCISSFKPASVSWPSRAGEKYWVLLHGSESEAGDFRITFKERELPPNDACPAAESILLSSGQTTAVTGSTYTATVEANATTILCRESDLPPIRGVWYQLASSGLPTGTTVVASTCSQYTEYAARISVYAGSCLNLACVASMDVPPSQGSECKEGSTVQWSVRRGASFYYILIHGATEYDTGRFSLSLEAN